MSASIGRSSMLDKDRSRKTLAGGIKGHSRPHTECAGGLIPSANAGFREILCVGEETFNILLLMYTKRAI